MKTPRGFVVVEQFEPDMEAMVKALKIVLNSKPEPKEEDNR